MKSGVTVLLRSGREFTFANATMEEFETAMARAGDAPNERQPAYNCVGARGECLIRFDEIVAFWAVGALTGQR